MLYKNIRRHTCHHITQQTAANSCDRSKKHKQKRIIHITLADSCINTHYRKNTKSHRIQHQHKLIVCLTPVSFQKFSLKIKNKENNARGKHRYKCIYRICKYSRWNDPQHHVSDHAASHRSCYSKNADAKNIHITLYSYHCSGSCKRDRTCHFHNKCHD